MFRGSAPTKIDDKGRLKIPTEFRRQLEDRFGPEVFVTSIEGDSAQIHPLSEWEAFEAKLAALPRTHKAGRKLLARVSYFGQQTKLDSQGRLVIPQILRERADMAGEVVVSGHLDHLVVWNRERFERRLVEDDFTDDDFESLSELGI